MVRRAFVSAQNVSSAALSHVLWTAPVRNVYVQVTISKLVHSKFVKTAFNATPPQRTEAPCKTLRALSGVPTEADVTSGSKMTKSASLPGAMSPFECRPKRFAAFALVCAEGHRFL